MIKSVAFAVGLKVATTPRCVTTYDHSFEIRKSYSAFCIFLSIKDVSKLASKARPFAAVIRQRLIVLSNVLDFVLEYELEENVLVSRKTENFDKYIDLASIIG